MVGLYLYFPINLYGAVLNINYTWYKVLYVYQIFFLANLQSTLQWSNRQICYKETLVRSNHPMMILLCILYVMLCVRLLF
jgi:hypothetical protein